MFDYQVSPVVWITGTFGRDYASSRQGSLLAQLGVSLNFAKERYGVDPGGN